jgi:tetratricopeptide (TPR) repeat protein
MVRMRMLPCVGLVAALSGFIQPAAGDTYPVIVRGTVVMDDGSPPPFTVAIERICSDSAGSAPGPITNKKGEFTWRIEIDPFAPRACLFRAVHAGYASSTTDASGLNTTSRNTTVTLPPLVLNGAVADAYAINASESNMPSRAKSPFDKAMKALDAGDFPEAARQLEAAVDGSPKFAQGWHALGVVDERLHKQTEARAAYEHAIGSDPKLLPPYMTLTRLCIKTKDWQCAANTADALIKADSRRAYPEIHLHRAVARYQLKDLAGAEASVLEAIRLDPKHKAPRAEYVLGRILEGKGDAAAREHISKYLELEPNAADAELVRAHLQNLGRQSSGNPDSAPEPELEPL